MQKTSITISALFILVPGIMAAASMQPKKFSYEEEFALAAAASAGDLAQVQELLAQGHNPNKQCKLLLSPLSCTPNYKDPKGDRAKIALALLQAQADPNLVGTLGYTPLMNAVIAHTGGAHSNHALALVKGFLIFGANWQAIDNNGRTVLSFAQTKPACRQLIEDHEALLLERWSRERKKILRLKGLPEEEFIEKILFMAQPTTAEELIKVTRTKN